MTDAPLDLGALEALIHRAEALPWNAHATRGALGVMYVIGHDVEHEHGEETCVVRSPHGEADARLIVAAVNALPALIAALRAARRERDALRPYVRHEDGCAWRSQTIPSRPACSCGLDAALRTGGE